MIGIGRRVCFLGLAGAALASLMTGCATEIKAERPASAPSVVVAQPSERVVVPRSSDTTTVVVTQPSDKVISYPEGSYKLYGDATRGYYWVWIPTGIVVTAPPTPPTLPRVTQGDLPVQASRPERVINYPQGRYDLYGNASTGYYWVWIPAGAMPPYPPPPPF